jgi:formiminotetrahydrofolate cyclodeaminase
MELSELTVASFANLLGSDAPAPGGGSAAALEGALGAALTSMICAVTVGRKKYEDSHALAQESMAKASDLKDRFLVAMEKDTEAFNMFGDAMAMPKETPEQKALRSAAMQKALRVCIDSPMHMMELAVEALELADTLMGKMNANALSDLGVGILSLGTALRGAWLNVRINLSGLKDEAAVAEYQIRGMDLLHLGMERSEDMYQRILEAL